MGRPKTFEYTRVLDKAMELFWRRGYEATSIHDLLDHLGISRQSLYDTFGDKHSLFLAALKRYNESKVTATIATLEAPGSGRAAIERVFHEAVQTLGWSEPRKACLMVNAAVERASGDCEVAQCVAASTARTEQAFYHALQRAQEQGELGAQPRDLRALAQFLTTVIQGLNVRAKTAADPDSLLAIGHIQPDDAGVCTRCGYAFTTCSNGPPALTVRVGRGESLFLMCRRPG